MNPKRAATHRVPTIVGTLRAVLADESGQGLAEYGLILGMIAVVCLVTIVVLGSNIKALLARVSTNL